ncbi:Sodium-coupled monocarboxylate transporter 1 [Homalodisca vitripennis]|nr:Sodium-coupled monocarboxylate transporter 1 [Homalodisca vitripennis]
MTIQVKLTRPVPLLVDNDVAEAIEVLLKNRSRGVSPENNHLFAKEENSYFNTNAELRSAAFECGAKHPEDITGTRLRKQIATISLSLYKLQLIGHGSQITLQFLRAHYQNTYETLSLTK